MVQYVQLFISYVPSVCTLLVVRFAVTTNGSGELRGSSHNLPRRNSGAVRRERRTHRSPASQSACEVTSATAILAKGCEAQKPSQKHRTHDAATVAFGCSRSSKSEKDPRQPRNLVDPLNGVQPLDIPNERSMTKRTPIPVRKLSQRNKAWVPSGSKVHLLS